MCIRDRTQSSARAEEEETYAKIATCRSRILQVEAQLHELLTKPAPQVDDCLLYTSCTTSISRTAKSCRSTHFRSRNVQIFSNKNI